VYKEREKRERDLERDLERFRESISRGKRKKNGKKKWRR
jgi:hypothetical protein